MPPPGMYLNPPPEKPGVFSSCAAPVLLVIGGLTCLFGALWVIGRLVAWVLS